MPDLELSVVVGYVLWPRTKSLDDRCRCSMTEPLWIDIRQVVSWNSVYCIWLRAVSKLTQLCR